MSKANRTDRTESLLLQYKGNKDEFMMLKGILCATHGLNYADSQICNQISKAAGFDELEGGEPTMARTYATAQSVLTGMCHWEYSGGRVLRRVRPVRLLRLRRHAYARHACAARQAVAGWQGGHDGPPDVVPLPLHHRELNMMEFKPFPFDHLHDAALLNAAGYECTHEPASWCDDGDVENGPHLSGGPAYDEWRRDNHIIIVCEGEVVHIETEQPLPDNFPF